MITDDLLEDLARFSRDPLGFVLWAFPWGEEDTELAGAEGPDAWQREALEYIRDSLMDPLEAMRLIRMAISSGNGIGKTTLFSWIFWWSLCTMPDTKGRITSGKEQQLRTTVWPEIAKWHRLLICGEMFKRTATRVYSADPDHEDTWRFDMVTWSEHNPQTVAGFHNKGRRLVLLFDEGAAIADNVWETAAGALTDTDTQIIWVAASNPVKNTGYFRDIFERFAHRWWTRKIDSRTTRIADKAQAQEWVDDYGEDHDFVRMRVKGEFPRVGEQEFISLEMAREANERDLPESAHAPLVFGVDVARYGDAASVIYRRRGRDGRSLPPIIMRGLDTMAVAARVANQAQIDAPDGIFVDEGGLGAGVVDRLRQLRVHCIGINFGSKADRLNIEGDESLYANKRSEMWGMMRSWIRSGAIVSRPQPDDNLINQLVAPLYGFNDRGEIMLEKKESMRKRGVASPDIADALALTFAYPVMARRDGEPAPRHEVDYDPLAAFTLEVA